MMVGRLIVGCEQKDEGLRGRAPVLMYMHTAAVHVWQAQNLPHVAQQAKQQASNLLHHWKSKSVKLV